MFAMKWCFIHYILQSAHCNLVITANYQGKHFLKIFLFLNVFLCTTWIIMYVTNFRSHKSELPASKGLKFFDNFLRTASEKWVINIFYSMNVNKTMSFKLFKILNTWHVILSNLVTFQNALLLYPQHIN